MSSKDEARETEGERPLSLSYSQLGIETDPKGSIPLNLLTGLPMTHMDRRARRPRRMLRSLGA